MPKSSKFKSNTGSPVSVYLPTLPDPIRVPADEPYVTADEAEIVALKGCPEVDEVKR